MAVDPFRMGRMKRVWEFGKFGKRIGNVDWERWKSRLGTLKRDAVRMGRLKRRLRRMRRGNMATNSVIRDLEYTSNGPDFAPSLDSILVDLDVGDFKYEISFVSST